MLRRHDIVTRKRRLFRRRRNGGENGSETMVVYRGPTETIQHRPPKSGTAPAPVGVVKKSSSATPPLGEQIATLRGQLPLDYRAGTKSPIAAGLYGTRDKWITLGKGNFGTVYKVTNAASGRTTVLKEILIPANRQEQVDQLKAVIREVAVLRRLKTSGCEPYMLCFDGLFEERFVLDAADPEGPVGAFYIRTDLLHDYVTLETAMRDGLFRSPRDDHRMATVISNLLRAVRALHKAQVAHRDLKPANIMVQVASTSTGKSGDGTGIRLIDYGESCIDGDCVLLEPHGSPMYMAPELWILRVTEKTPALYGLEAAGVYPDLWALGVTLWELMYHYLEKPTTTTTLVDVWVERAPEFLRQQLERYRRRTLSTAEFAQRQADTKRLLDRLKPSAGAYGFIKQVMVFLESFDYKAANEPVAAESRRIRETLQDWTKRWGAQLGELSLDFLLIQRPAVQRKLPLPIARPTSPKPQPIPIPGKSGGSYRHRVVRWRIPHH